MENQAAPVAAVAAPTANVDNPYGLVALWQTGDIVARSVLVLLVIMSLASWYVMLTKLWDQRKLRQSVRVVEKQFWTAPSVKDGVERLKKGDEFRGIAEAGANKETRIFMGHGDVDQVVRYQFGKLTADTLTEWGYKVDFKTYRGLGHSADPQEISDFEDFLKKTIPPLPEESSQGNL